MKERPISSRRKISIRATFDLIMGAIYLLVGGALVLSGVLEWKLAFPPKEYAWVFGLFAALYGSFRLYRGYQSFYLEEE